MFEEINHLTSITLARQLTKVQTIVDSYKADAFIRSTNNPAFFFHILDIVEQEAKKQSHSKICSSFIIYGYAWLTLIDPKISISEKQALCRHLFETHTTPENMFSNNISDLPAMMKIHFLTYSNLEATNSCYEATYAMIQEETESHLDYFQNSVNLVINSKAFDADFKKLFFENLYVFLEFKTTKERVQTPPVRIDYISEAIACWLRYHKKPFQDAYQLVKQSLPNIYHQHLEIIIAGAVTLKRKLESLAYISKIEIKEPKLKSYVNTYQFLFAFKQIDISQMEKSIKNKQQIMQEFESLQSYINSISYNPREHNPGLRQFDVPMAALNDHRTRCDTMLTIFSHMTSDKWPAMFVLFKKHLTRGNFPSSLKLNDDMPEVLKSIISSKPTYRMWLDVLPQLSDILQTTLSIIAKSYNGYLSETEKQMLDVIHIIFYEMNLSMETNGFTILKDIFEKDSAILFPLLLQLKLTTLPYRNVYHCFSLNDETIAMILPEDSETRTDILAQYVIEYLVRTNDYLFKSPYIRNDDEQALVIKKLYQIHQDKPMHVFLNLCNAESRDMVVKHLFAIDKSFMAEKFVFGICTAFTPYDDDDEILNEVIKFVTDLKSQGFDAKNLINTLIVKDKIEALIQTPSLWSCFAKDFTLLFELHPSLSSDEFYGFWAEIILEEFTTSDYAAMSLLLHQFKKLEKLTKVSFGQYVQQHPEYSIKFTELFEQNPIPYCAHTQYSIALLRFFNTFIENLHEKILHTFKQAIDDLRIKDIPISSSEERSIKRYLNDLVNIFGRHLIQSQCSVHPQLNSMLIKVMVVRSIHILKKGKDTMFPVRENISADDAMKDHSPSQVITSAAK